MKTSHLILIFIATLALLAGAELSMGRLFFGPDGKFGFWETSIWSSENSQRLADPYSFSHIVHGIAFYGLLWLMARRLPVEKRLLVALFVEAGWELLENSPIIINRYREATVALGYTGDSVINSMSDVLMMTLGFCFASRVKPAISLVAVAIMEIGCAWWVRDNLTLNIIMLIHPVEAIKHWQLAGQPHP
ncbi:MAG: DUF2585 family protein [Verrucomicrobiae bacterium]|nr:DUF2585 family protein [Verrucomicrobiae bacterium]